MELMTIASGSSGNSIYVASLTSKILVDVGISKKRIETALNDINTSLSEINGILITHEHIDHICGLGVILRSFKIPVYATFDTIEEIKANSKLGEFNYDLLVPIEPDIDFFINDIRIEAHTIWHDAADPVCFSLYSDDKKISIATDIGGYDDYLVEKLKNSDALVIESNHDVKMVEVGPYPYYLKRRILGNRGHLSNENCGKLILEIINNKLKLIFLGHLSHENNYEVLAYETVKLEIQNSIENEKIEDFNLRVASRKQPSELLYI